MPADIKVPQIDRSKSDSELAKVKMEAFEPMTIEEWVKAGGEQDSYASYVNGLKQYEQLWGEKVKNADTIGEVQDIIGRVDTWRKQNFPTIKEVADSSPYIPPSQVKT